MKYGIFVFSVLAILFSMNVAFAHAQATSIDGTINDVAVNVFPDTPGANQEVTLKIQSYLLDITSADISWSIDGKPAQHGVGLTTFKFTTKDVGQPTTIDVSVLPVGGYVINKELTITPSSVDILWESVDSIVSPFYKGKALPTSQATLKFVAIPNMKTLGGSFVNPKDIIYSWQNDYTLDIDSSGYGKDSYIVEMPIIDQGEDIEVKAQMRGGGASAEQEVSTAIYTPKILWYATSPLYGPQFERAVNDGFTISSNDISVFAEPFFATPKDITSSDLSYAWQLNNDSLGAQSPANILTLHRNNSNQGDAIVNLTIENSKKYLQELTSSLTLHLQ